ncbi:MAG: NAD(P)/FAD-dependent oxidoreductase [Chloroflexi bacterium]|nr:NAD(P)/FAD-dependent oxidoreductase [Chloroflexota bacterium]
MHRVLIAGGGVGGLTAAHKLRQLLPPEDEIIVFDQSAVHTFWPSLLWVMSGTRRADQVVRPFRALREHGITVRQGQVTAINPRAPSVTVEDREQRGDAVIVALGATLAPERVPGLAEGGLNLYTLAGAEEIWRRLQALEAGQVAVLISSSPFKCPAAPYEAAMLIDGYLRKRRRRDRVEVALYAAEPAPMGVAGPAVSAGVVTALTERDIAYYPNAAIEKVDAAAQRLFFRGGREGRYDLLVYVPPHRAPDVVASAGLAAADSWVTIDRERLETPFPNVFAIGDIVGIPLAQGKLLPKAGVFAEGEGEVVAQVLAQRWLGREGARFTGQGACFIEMGRGVAGFARGNFYAEPVPAVKVYSSGRHWHLAKIAFERQWWSRWW